MNRLPGPSGPWDIDLTPAPPPRAAWANPWRTPESHTHERPDVSRRGRPARTPAQVRPTPSVAAALAWYALLGGTLAAAARSVMLSARECSQPREAMGPLVVAAFLGAFTSLGIGMADLTIDGRREWRVPITALAGSLVGTAGSFLLVVPALMPLPVLVRLVALSSCLAVASPWAGMECGGAARGEGGGPRALLVLAGAGVLAGVATSLRSLTALYDPYPWPAAQAALVMGAIGVAVALGRETRDAA